MKIRKRNRNNPKETVRNGKIIQRQKEKEFYREEELPREKQRQIEKQKKRQSGQRICPCTQ